MIISALYVASLCVGAAAFAAYADLFTKHYADRFERESPDFRIDSTAEAIRDILPSMNQAALPLLVLAVCSLVGGFCASHVDPEFGWTAFGAFLLVAIGTSAVYLNRFRLSLMKSRGML